jgi:hypothetical protein
MNKTKEEELLETTKEFAKTNNIPYSNIIATMVLNAYREGFKDGFEAYLSIKNHF